MSTNTSKMVFNFLKSNYGSEFTKRQIADALGVSIPVITGSVNALREHGYVEERIVTENIPATATKKASTKVTRYEKLTEAGLSYDPVKEELEKKNIKK